MRPVDCGCGGSRTRGSRSSRPDRGPRFDSSPHLLSIPAIRDRVVQGALKLILEPIFEADFQPGSFGYRPKRIAHEANPSSSKISVARVAASPPVGWRARHPTVTEALAFPSPQHVA